jgi:hypothetical protein
MDLISTMVKGECAISNPYQFAIQYPTNSKKTVPVNLVMPLGGIESGLYRSPKIGEKVLVASVTGEGNTTTYYRMGYLPDN